MPPRKRRSRSRKAGKDGEDSAMTDLDPINTTSAGACMSGDSMEAMVVVEGMWGEEQEVSMDVDLTEEDERGFLSEILLTRGAVQYLATPSFLSDGSVTLSSTFSQPAWLYIILDTNVLLAHLHFLMELKDTPLRWAGRPVLVVPWVVMQELDALKGSSKSKVSGAAATAISSLHDCFASRHPRVRGQTMEEVHTEVNNMAIESNDDKILHCCLLYQARVKGQQGQVVLFSNDMQLCNKALVNNITALSRKTLLVELRQLCQAMQEATPTSSSIASSNTDIHAAHPPSVTTAVQDVLLECEQILQETLSAVVAMEMELAFDSLWTSVVVIKPPWALADLIHILDKHWIAVFGLVMHTSYRLSNLQPLINHVKTKDKMICQWSDVELFVSSSVHLLKACPHRPMYQEKVLKGVAALQALLNRARQSSSATPPSPGGTTNPSSQLPHSQLPPTSGQARGDAESHMGSGHASTLSGHASTSSDTHVVHLSMEDVGQLTQSIPASPQQQLPWILNIILYITRQCLSKLAVSLSSAAVRDEVTAAAARLATVLQSVLTTITQLVQDVSVAAVRDFRAAVDVFLLTYLQISCPLSLQMLCELVPAHVPLLLQATHECSSAMDTLQLLAKQYALPL